MTTYSYTLTTNAAVGYKQNLGGVEFTVGTPLSYSSDQYGLNVFVPEQLDRLVDGVISNTNLITPYVLSEQEKYIIGMGSINTDYTAVQLSALAAAGGLTAGATYVASDTNVRMDAVSASQLARSDVGIKSTICFFGDSLIQYNVGRLGQAAIATGSPTIGTIPNILWADFDTPAGAGGVGAGRIVYDATAKTLQWTAAGDTPGPLVDGSKPGLLKLPSGTDRYAVYLSWFGGDTPYSTGIVDVAVSAAGNQLWSYSARGLGVVALASIAQPFRLAPLPTSLGCPPGMDGYYGLGGGTSLNLLHAREQWTQIQSDIDVIQVGTNDIGGGRTPAEYLASIQSFILGRLTTGTSLVIWTTIVPRDTDTVTKQQYKAQIASAMCTWAATQSGRVIVWDAASYVTDPANGLWISGYSVGDGIHPGVKGAEAIGIPLGALLAQLAPANSKALPASYNDVYDATANPGGNLLGVTGAGVPLMQGVGGTLGAGASGTVATGWTAARNSGAAMTLTCSTPARTDGVPGNWQQIVLGASVADEKGRLILTTADATGLVVGAQYQLEAEISVVASSSMNLLDLKLTTSGITGGGRVPQAFAGTTNHLNFTSSQTFWLRTPPNWIVSAGATKFQPEIDFGVASGGSATIRIGRVRLVRTA